MRVSFPSDLKEKIVHDIAQTKKPKRIVAQYDPEKEPSTVEEATEHAKAYWMMGFTWEEIDSILEDMEYSEATVNKAIKKTQEYAHEKLNNGPFRTLKEGQLVKLKNGTIAKLKHKYEEGVSIVAGKETVNTKLSNIDVDATKLLSEAFALREAANKLLRDADETSLEEVDPLKELEPKMEEQFKHRTTPKMQTPKEWKQYLPEQFVDVPEADRAIEYFTEELLALRQQKEEVDKQLKEAFEQYKEWKQLSSAALQEETEMAKKIAGILGTEQEASDRMETVLFRRLDDLLVGYIQHIEPENKPPKFVDKHNELIRLIQEKAPEVFEEVMDALNAWEEANMFIKETLKTELAVSKPPKEILGQNLWEKAKNWLGKLWNKVKSTTQDLYSNAFPAAEEIADALEEFMSEAAMQQAASKYERLLSEIKF